MNLSLAMFLAAFLVLPAGMGETPWSRAAASDAVGAEPAPVSSNREASLKTFLQRYAASQQAAGGATRFSSAFVDLRGSGARQAIVYLTGPDWCGSGGCTALILDSAGASFKIVTSLSVTRLPIYVLKSTTNGWRDIAVLVAGGGIFNAYEARLRFNGKSYPDNPTVAPAQPIKGKADGTVVISSRNAGAPLYP